MKFKLATCLLAALALKSQAQSVEWGTSSAFDNANGTQSFLSTGAAMPASVIWDIGYFTTGFTPDATNYSLWNSNWISVANPLNTVSVGPDYVISGHIDDPGAAAYGKKGYVWAYSDKTAMGVPGTETLLVTESDWIFPTTGNYDMDIADNPFSAVDDNMTVVWGRVDRLIGDVGGVVEGAGDFTTKPGDSTSTTNATFEVQLGTWAAAPVPEPSSLLVSALGLLSLFGRRKRR